MLKFDRFSIVVFLVVLIDQITKSSFKTIVSNTGASFGFLTGFNWFFVLISFLVIGFIIYYKGKIKSLGLAILMGGVIGNLVDRIVFGYVRDFIQIWFWPAFNLADLFNVVGVLLIIIYLYKK